MSFNFQDMTYNQIKQRPIPWIFLKRKSPTKKDSEEFFQVPVEALLKVDKLASYDERNINSDTLICFLNQLQFIRYKSLQMKQIYMRQQYNVSGMDIYCPNDDFSLERALRDSFDGSPISNENKLYSFLVHKWGVDLNIHKSNEMLRIILDHLLARDEKLKRLSNSLDIRHVDDPLFDPDVKSDNENEKGNDPLQSWLASKKRERAQQLKENMKNDMKNSHVAKKTKITTSEPHELTPTRKSSSNSPTNDQAIPQNTSGNVTTGITS